MEPDAELDGAEQRAVSPIAAIVLAAGRSSRMGRHKLLLPLGGRPIVAHVVAAACAIRTTRTTRAGPILVVVGHEAERVRAAVTGECLSEGLRFVISEDYASGMASSLRAGIATVPAECRGALVLLGDQPLLRAELLDRLLWTAEAHQRAIVAATYGGRRGNPVYFPREYFAELEAVTGDMGGRSVVARHTDRVIQVECADLGEPLDVDDPADYTRAQALWAKREKDHADGPPPDSPDAR